MAHAGTHAVMGVVEKCLPLVIRRFFSRSTPTPHQRHMTTPSMLPQRIVFLDYLRIFAFSSVLAGHKFYPQLESLAGDTTLHCTIQVFFQALLPLCHGGAAGVIVFFLVSGYIITHVLQKETVLQFAIKRVFRIYPLYIAAVLLECVAQAADGTPWPSFAVLIPRMLLLGDFFNTPYALAGVEWTLRVEILFYAFMALLKLAGLLQRPRVLPAVFVVSAFVLHSLPPFPAHSQWTFGYLTLYGPFLFIGVLAYLAEARLATNTHCLAAALVLFTQFLILLPQLHPAWKESHYALYSVGIFACAWGARNLLQDNLAIRLLSAITYSVYLFHNLAWSYLEYLVARGTFSFPLLAVVPPKLLVLLLLLTGCYGTYALWERGGIALGRRLLTAISASGHRSPPRSPETPPVAGR